MNTMCMLPSYDDPGFLCGDNDTVGVSFFLITASFLIGLFLAGFVLRYSIGVLKGNKTHSDFFSDFKSLILCTGVILSCFALAVTTTVALNLNNHWVYFLIAFIISTIVVLYKKQTLTFSVICFLCISIIISTMVIGDDTAIFYSLILIAVITIIPAIFSRNFLRKNHQETTKSKIFIIETALISSLLLTIIPMAIYKYEDSINVMLINITARNKDNGDFELQKVSFGDE